MKRTRSFVLFALALAALALFFLVEMPQRREAARHAAEASRLCSFDPASVDAISLRRPESSLEFVLSGSHWEMLAPVRDAAELAAVAPILSTLADAEVLRDLGPEDPSRYGLSPPVAAITLVAARDTVARIDLGNYTVDRSAVYARRSDGRVVLVPTAIHRAVMLHTDEYRNRRVAVFDLSAVQSFVLDSRLTGTTRWLRGSGETWFTVVAGDTVRGDSVAVPSVLRRLRGMRVSSFVDEADSIPSAASLLTITIAKKDGSTNTVQFFDEPAGACRTTDGFSSRTVVIADDPSDLAAESVATLRDRRVLHFDPALVVRITVVTPDTSAVIVRAGGRWALPNPALGAVHPGRAADFIRALRSLRFTRLAGSATPDAPARPSFSLVVYGSGATILDEVNSSPGARDGDAWIVRSQSLGSACEVDAAVIEEIVAKLRRIRQ